MKRVGVSTTGVVDTMGGASGWDLTQEVAAGPVRPGRRGVGVGKRRGAARAGS